MSESTAEEEGLIYVNGSQVYMGADMTNVIHGNSGRPSVRISSKNSYTTGLFLIDLEHMPTGCGTWPAFWLVGPDWYIILYLLAVDY